MWPSVKINVQFLTSDFLFDYSAGFALHFQILARGLGSFWFAFSSSGRNWSVCSKHGMLKAF